MTIEMNIFRACVFLPGGLVILWKSAEYLVEGAVALARRLGVSPLAVGLTVVAMGTSAPEVAASIAAVFQESGGDIAIGNVYGSNIANLALVGGLCALIRPIVVRKRALRCEMPIMLVVALLLWPLLRNLRLSNLEGIILLIVFGVFLLVMVHLARRESVNSHSGRKNAIYEAKSASRSLLLVVAGLVGLALGAKLAVEGSVFIGRGIGLSEAVIGLTIIAIGTSLPELVTCIVAAVKKQDDISIGNLVGSNIFNTLLVTGTAGVIHPFALTRRLAGGIDYWIMVAVSLAFVVVVISGRRKIGRAGGTLLLGGYFAYIVYLLAFSV